MAYPNLKQSIGLVAALMLIELATGLLFHFLGAEPGRNERFIDYAQWVTSLPVFALLALYARRRARKPWTEVLLFRNVPLQTYLSVLVCVAGLSLSLFNLGNFVQYLIPAPEEIIDIFRKLLGPNMPYAFAFFILVIQASLTEEVMFRGVILGGLLAHGSRRRAIVWSAVLFGIIHMNPWQSLPAFILGLVFAWWVVRTGSLLPAIFGHALNNFLSLTLARLGLFGPIENWDVPVFLPWWLQLCGIALAIFGLWWFNQISRGAETLVEARAEQEPG